VIGVGGDHVTNDVAIAFNCNTNQAERLKREHGSATVDESDADKRAELPNQMPGADPRTISVRALDTVINARMGELFKIVLQSLDAGGYSHRLGAGAVLTGGGASLKNVAQLAARELGMQTRIGLPVNVDGLENEEHPASLAAIAGALVYSGESERAEMHGGIGGFLRRIFK
jgi:cell division protein FtsA